MAEASDKTTHPAPGAQKKKQTSPARGAQKCSVEGCKRPYRAKRYCVVHYNTWRRGERASTSSSVA